MCDLFLSCSTKPNLPENESEGDTTASGNDEGSQASSRTTKSISFTESSDVSNLDEQEKYSHKKYSWFWYFPLTMFWLVVLPCGPLFFHYVSKTYGRNEEFQHPGDFKGYKADNFVQEFASIGSKWFALPEFWKSHEYLRNRLDEILSNVVEGILDYEIDIDRISGSMYHQNVLFQYNDLINIALKIQPTRNGTYPTLLISANYDSFVSSPGAGNANSVAVMVEMLRLYCLEIPKKFKSYNTSIIFLFIGANYNSRLSVYQFFHTNSWRQRITAFISMETFASGGRELLVRSSQYNHWLLDCYSKVPYPFGISVFSYLHHLFEPYGKTRNFDIIERELHIPGLELALVEDGYVFQTRLDRFDRISNHTCQTIGENMMVLVEKISTSKEFRDKTYRKVAHADYNSILGLFIVIKTHGSAIVYGGVGIFWCLLCILFSIIRKADQLKITIRQMLSKFKNIFLLQVGALLSGCLVNILTSIILDNFVMSLSYYKSIILTSGLYLINAMMASSFVVSFFLERHRGVFLPITYSVAFLLHSHSICICFFIIVELCIQQSSVLFIISLYFYNISMTLTALYNGFRHVPKVGKKFYRESGWIFIHCVCQLPCIICFGYCAYAIEIVVNPLLGLLGPMNNPDVYPAIIGFITCILSTYFLIPIYQLFSHAKAIYKIYPIFLVLLVIIVLSPIGYPFDRHYPQKFHGRHTARVYYTNGIKSWQDSGFVLIPFDRRLHEAKNAIENYSMETIVGRSPLCKYKFQKQNLFCGMPIFTPSEFNMGFHYIETPISGGLEGTAHLRVLYINQSFTSDNLKFFHFVIEGPPIILAVIVPAWNTRLVKWNMKPNIPDLENFKPPHIVHFSYGDEMINHTLKLYFEKYPFDAYSLTFRLIVIGHSFDEDTSDNFKKFLDSFPEFIVPTFWKSKVEIHECV